MTRRQIDSMTFPDELKPDPAVLAESVADAFAVASIAGGRGEQELRFVAPESLVVVISATSVQFFAEPDEVEDEDEDGEVVAVDGQIAAETPEDAAEDIKAYLEQVLGLVEEEEEADDEPLPEDEADRQAVQVVGALLERGWLELATPRSRAQVEGRLAHLLAHGVRGAGRLAEAIADCSGVAEFYADDAQLAELLARARGE